MAYVLHGTYRSDGKTQRVFARLSRTSDGEDVWQDEFDHQVSDVFAAEDEIRDSVVAALQVTCRGPAQDGSTDRVEPRHDGHGGVQPVSTRPVLSSAVAARGVALAAEHFQHAIDRDSAFARAHAGLAAALEILP